MSRSALTVSARARRRCGTGPRGGELAPVDLVAPTRMLLPVTAVADALLARGAELDVHLLGDCAQPRTALEAIHDAAALAHRF